MKKVIAAGHICIDITPAFTGEKVTSVSQVLKPGKLVQMDGVNVHTGGAVANTGLAMKILGADVSLMGKIGDDEFGRMVQGILREYDADGGMIISPGEQTSYSVVLAIPGVDRIFLHDPGANDTFSPEDVSAEALKDASLFHFGYPPLMAKMYEKEGAGLVALFEKVKAAGPVTSLDLAAVDPNSPAGKVDWKKILQKVLPLVDFFVPSVEELCFMLDRPRFEEWQRRAGDRDLTELLDPETDIRPLAMTCLEYGAGAVLIKSGAPGMFFKAGSRERLQPVLNKLDQDPEEWAGLEIFEKSYQPERILSGTGAGDTSIAAFLTAILKGESPQMALHLAAATGACCLAAMDSLGGLKPLGELKEKIAAGWAKRE